jgi:hypothetical protein
MDPLQDARDLVAERFPGAVAAFLGGSILSARRTATSDLDIVVVLTGPPAPYRESLRWRTWPVELFVHDADSLEHFFGQDRARRRPTLARLCSSGIVLTGPKEHTDQIRQRSGQIVAAGPAPLSQAEIDSCRYGLTDLLDDLSGGTDPAETAVISWHAWVATAELALALAGHWSGSAKWLLRELRDAEPALADRMVAAIGDPERVQRVADHVLARAGGRFWAGYTVTGPGRQPG